MVNSTGLGKGLSSLIPKKQDQGQEGNQQKNSQLSSNVTELKLEQIVSNPYQPRETFEHQALEELVESIKEHGVLQPLVVTELGEGKYELVAGERRLRACQLLGKEVVPVVVRSASKQEKLELALIENIQRRDLNPLERARAYKKLAEEFSLTQEQIAKKVSKPRAHVANSLRYLNLPREIQVALADIKISESHAKIIAGLESEAEQLKFFKRVVQRKLSVRDLEDDIERTAVKGHTRKKSFDPIVMDQQKKLEQALGTKVKINKLPQGGKILIDCYSEEEYEKIIGKLSE